MDVLKEQFKETKLGKVPADWKVLKFGEVFEFIKTSSHSKVQMTYGETESEIYNVHYGAIHTTYREQLLNFDKYNVPKIIDDSKTPTKNQFLQDGDVVIVDASEDADGMGECVEIFNIEGRKVIGGLHTFAVRDKGSFYAKGFAGYIFKNTSSRNKLIGIANISKVYGVSKGNIISVPLLIPTIPEQQKIAEILSTVDEQISTTQSIIDKSKQLKKGLMQKLFSEGIGHTEFKDTKIGRIPQSWDVVQLQDLCSLITYGLTVRPKYFDDGIPLISAKEIRQGYVNSNSAKKINQIAFDKLSNKSKAKKGDLFFSKTGTIGLVAQVKDDIDLAITQNIAMIRIVSDMVNTDFMEFVFRSIQFQKSALAKVNQSTIMDFQLRDLRKMRVPIPSALEQQKIAEILSEADAKIEKEEQEKTQLEQLKKGLMQQLLTGKKRVKV
ncbi:restriction endonuclease subunit S [Algibacter sp.]|nr:restriction endonuclease subunit S [Algibacter sp.]MDA9069184.1 restriction endonuclease subunit S [Algibacter sp.]MDC1365024.1 restriction endonuclease subunit S [Algibacter sp.]